MTAPLMGVPVLKCLYLGGLAIPSFPDAAALMQDISKDIVKNARNATEAGVEVEFRHGSVADIPFPDDTFDFIVCTTAFKNFKEPLKGLRHMYRVLRMEGTALIIDINENASDHQIED